MSIHIPKKDFAKLSVTAKRKLSQAVKSAEGSGRRKAPISLGGRGDYKPRYRKRRTFRGRGDYSMNSKFADASDSEFVGEGISRIGKGIAKMIGFGDYAQVPYSVKENSILSALGSANSPPSMMSTLSKSFIVRHREYLGDIVTSGITGAFNVQYYNINPGLASTFPWLSSIATSFQQYRINGMVFETRSLAADAVATSGTNNGIGWIAMATEYNASTPNPFPNKQAIENQEFASSAKQSQSMMHPIECMRTQTPVSQLFIRSGAVPTGQDQRLYDMGKFAVATGGGQAANVNISELWLSYEVEFFKPTESAAEGFDIGEDHIYVPTSTTANYFSTSSAVYNPFNQIGCSASGQTITFPSYVNEGSYNLYFDWVGGNAAVTPPSITPVGCTFVYIFEGPATSNPDLNNIGQAPNNGVTSARLNVFIRISVTAAGPTLTFGGSGGLPTACKLDVLITQANALINY